jgi:hypothetical protein
MKVRAVPWLLAFGALAILLVSSRYDALPGVIVWLVFLAVGWLLVTRYRYPLTRTHRIALAIVLLLILVLRTPGGWWLVPAVLAWLAIEIFDPLVRREPRQS